MTFDYKSELNGFKFMTMKMTNKLSGNPSKDIDNLRELRSSLENIIFIANRNISGWYIARNSYNTGHQMFTAYILFGHMTKQQALEYNKKLDYDSRYRAEVIEVSSEDWKQYSELAKWQNIQDILSSVDSKDPNVTACYQHACERINKLSNALDLSNDTHVEFYKE